MAEFKKHDGTTETLTISQVFSRKGELYTPFIQADQAEQALHRIQADLGSIQDDAEIQRLQLEKLGLYTYCQAFLGFCRNSRSDKESYADDKPVGVVEVYRLVGAQRETLREGGVITFTNEERLWLVTQFGLFVEIDRLLSRS